MTCWLFYAVNDAPAGITGAFDHQGDRERISVRLNDQNHATDVAFFPGPALADRPVPGYGFGGAWGEVGAIVDTTGPLGPSRYKPAAPSDWSQRC